VRCYLDGRFIKSLRWISPSLLGEESGDSPKANLVVVRTSYINSVRNKPLNVGDKLRRYEKMDVASHLVCDVISASGCAALANTLRPESRPIS